MLCGFYTSIYQERKDFLISALETDYNAVACSAKLIVGKFNGNSPQFKLSLLFQEVTICA